VSKAVSTFSIRAPMRSSLAEIWAEIYFLSSSVSIDVAMLIEAAGCIPLGGIVKIEDMRKLLKDFEIAGSAESAFKFTRK
jgi:hypothetical protein